MSRYTLFVYGTLKKGFDNHHLLRGAEYLGKGRTKRKFALYVEGIPYVVKEPATSFIYGELYQVNASQIERIDWLEGHPSWYCREQIQVVDLNKKTVAAWLYLFPSRVGILDKTGRYKKIRRPE